jgi:hypothetical protein
LPAGEFANLSCISTPSNGRGSGCISLPLSVNSFSTINNTGAPSAGTSSTTELKPASHPLLPLVRWLLLRYPAATSGDMTSPSVVHSDGADLLRVAVAAYLARYKGLSRYHTESDLHVFLRWCTDRGHAL